MQTEIFDILKDIGISETNMKVAEEFFDFSKEMNLELIKDVEFQDLHNLNDTINDKSRDFLSEMEKEISEYSNRYILFLDAVGADTIYNLLSYNFLDEYIKSSTFRTQISSAFSNIHDSYETIYNYALSGIGKISALIAGSSDSLYFEEILVNTAKSCPEALLMGGIYCNKSSVNSKLKLFGLGLASCIPANSTPTKYDLIEIDSVKYLMEMLENIEIKDKETFDFIISVCFMAVKHSKKIENYIQDKTLGKKSDFFTAIITTVPNHYFEKGLDKFIELCDIEQSEEFTADCIKTAISYAWTENGYNAELFLERAAIRYQKQFTEIMYSTEKAKSITKNIDKADFCKYYTVENIHKSGQIKEIGWLYKSPNITVHFNNGSLADDKYMQAIMLCYSGMRIKFGNDEISDFLAKYLNQEELNKFVAKIFSKWIEQGAKANKEWVLYFSAIHGGTSIVDTFLNYISEWEQSSRRAIAATAVKALALNRSDAALKGIKNIAHNSKYKQVKSAAEQVLNKNN